MQDCVHLAVDVDIVGDVLFDIGKTGIFKEALDILDAPSDEIVYRDYAMALTEKMLAKMAADESGSARDHEPLHGRPTPL
jgi:hypothetical protein